MAQAARVGLTGGLCSAPPAPVVVGSEKPRGKKLGAKNAPKLVAAARELRDWWLEHVNAGGMVLECGGKYDLARPWHLDAPAMPPFRALPHAA